MDNANRNRRTQAHAPPNREIAFLLAPETATAPLMSTLSSLRELARRPGASTVAANLAWLLADKGIRLVLGILVGTWVARHLGPADYGLFSYTLAIASLLAVPAAFGLDGLVRRELVDSVHPAPRLLGTTFLVRLAIATGLYLGLALTVGFATTDAPLRRGLLFSGTLLFQPALLTPDLWVQSRQRSHISVLAQSGTLLLSSVARVMLIVNDAPWTAFAALVALDVVLPGLILAIRLQRSDCAPNTWRWDTAVARDLAHRAWPLVLSGIAVVVYLKLDQAMVKLLAGDVAAGHYAAAVKLSEILFLGPLVLASAVFPTIVRARAASPSAYERRMRQYLAGSALAAYALALPLALLSPFIVRLLYGPDYAATASIFALHVWSIVFVAQGVARQEWLLGEGLVRFSLAATTAGAVCNVVLNFLLIPRFGAVGAAIATLISLALSDVASSFFAASTREFGRWQLRSLVGAWKLPPAP